MAYPDGVPATYKELERELRARLGALTPHQQRLARRVLADPEGCAFQTVTQLAESVGVNESTVVRFATALGLSGYPALARLCQQRLREQAQLVERFEALHYLESAGGPGDLPHRAATLDQANIARTFARIEETAWKGAVQALASARVVQVVGLRKSYSPASLLAYLLGLVRDDVHQLGKGTFPEGLRRLGEKDTLAAISIHRYVRETVRAVEVAHRRGVTTIAITDNASSPLVAHADHVFYADLVGVSILRSVTAITSLVQALASAVAVELGAETREALLGEEALLAEFDVFVDAAADDPRREHS